MKKVFLLVAAAALLTLGTSCETKRPEKTIENLKAAITGETGAMTKYAAYAQKADEEGYANIANLFRAASRAEALHIANHKEVLKSLNVEFDLAAPEVEVDSTLSNLHDALNGETYETETMYPNFLKDAEEEQVAAAAESFKWAMLAEKDHALLFDSMIALLGAETQPVEAGAEVEGQTEAVIVFHVCPKCGFIYSNLEGVDTCEVCNAPVATFEAF